MPELRCYEPRTMAAYTMPVMILLTVVLGSRSDGGGHSGGVAVVHFISTYLFFLYLVPGI